MSTTKTTPTPSIEKLKKLFDIVDVQQYEYYDQIICKNKSTRNSLIDYEVWLDIKTKRKFGAEKLASEILDHIDKLFAVPKIRQVQTGLFEELEIEKDESSFWESFNSYFIYDDDDYLKLLPQSNEEMIKLCKHYILLGIEDEDRHDEYWFENNGYISSDEALSDRELLSRLYSILRICFVENSHNGCDWKTYRYFASYHAQQYTISHDSGDAIVYDLNQPEFVAWLRDIFNVPFREPTTDKEMIKQCLNDVADRLFGSLKDITFKEILDKATNKKTFTSSIKSLFKKDSGYSGGGGPRDDCYSSSITQDSGVHLEIVQRTDYRQSLGRDISQAESGRNSYTTVLDAKDNELYELMYDMFSTKPQYTQALLF